MDLKLTVLAGARKGTVIPLKKDEFVIGRAAECTLRAGSEAISRQHCRIERTSDGYVASDMGSRNGTYVNDQRIKERTHLRAGDELRVGPLKFRIDRWDRTMKKASSKPDSGQGNEPATPSSDSTLAVENKAGDHSVNGGMEDDISRWLIGTEPSGKAMQETVNFRIEDTRAVFQADAVTSDSDVSSDSDEESAVAATSESETEDSKRSGWSSVFNRGKSKESVERKKPGKLPKIPEKDKAKDSREAAAEILREMTRRR